VAQRDSRRLLKRLEKIDFHGIKIELSGSKQPAWRPAADEFLNLLKESDAPLLFLLDEFPAFLNLVVKKTSRDEAEAALNWFRSARHELSDSSARFLVTGSIGLKSVVRALASSPPSMILMSAKSRAQRRRSS